MSQEASELLEQIATAILLEETQNQNKENVQTAKYSLKSAGSPTDRFTNNVSSDDVDESEEEFFEDGDEEEEDEEEEIKVENENEKIVFPSFSSSQHNQQQKQQQNHHQDTAAAVLTELSQATSNVVTTKAPTSTPSLNPHPPQIVPRGSLANPNMTATINSINAFLQSHLHASSSSSSQQPHKVRLSGPIRANINIRHGVWAPRLRCRKRKNLHAKDGIWIHPDCTVENLVTLVKNVLPDEFDWDAQASPLRYQAVNDQSLQSLKTVSGTVAAGQSLYSAFDLVRNRRSDGDNFILQLFVYGTWTVLLKSLHLPPHTNEDEPNSNSVMIMSSSMSSQSQSHMQPPPKKKYQQAHYHQMQMTLNGIGPNSMNMNMNLNNGNTNENLNQNRSSNSNNLLSQVLSHPSNSNNSHTHTHNHTHSLPQSNFYTHPLAANPPVTFLPTLTLEMQMNGTFIPMEISRRSFIAAIRACSMPKPGGPSPPPNGNYISPTAPTSTSTSIHKDESSSFSTTCSIQSTNSTPPPSES